MNVVKKSLVVGVILSISACTWVDVTPEGEKIRLLSDAEVASCKHLGKTTVRTAGKIGVLDRYPEKVQAELNTLAKNSAADMGGDSIVPAGLPMDGSQVFEVYRCIPAVK